MSGRGKRPLGKGGEGLPDPEGQEKGLWCWGSSLYVHAGQEALGDHLKAQLYAYMARTGQEHETDEGQADRVLKRPRLEEEQGGEVAEGEDFINKLPEEALQLILRRLSLQ